MEINHHSHEHPLVLMYQEGSNESQGVKCYGCNEAMEGCSGYNCGSCKFFLHKKCAELPDQINHPLHLKHPLKLFSRSRTSAFSCCVCGHKDEGFSYYCSTCYPLEFDIRCATHPQFLSEDLQKLSHFSHNHALILVKDVHFGELLCQACQEQISSPFYSCFDCRFYLHKACVELPLKIDHPSHRKHPLALLTHPPVHPSECSCYLCKESWVGFVYHCSICNFSFKSIEASLQIIKPQIHEHSFTSSLKPVSFICDACGTQEDQYCFPYTCSECGLMVHRKCATLSKTIKITRHQHRLSHVFFFRDEEDRKRDCGICGDEVNMAFGSYCCLDCKYFVHINCGLDEFYLEDENQELKLSSHVFEEVKHGDQRQHFSHEHSLTYNDRADDGKDCDGCMRRISRSFYHCVQCDFFLHQNCFELPFESRHWICKHPKTLNFYIIFWCWYCSFDCSGFGYRCDSCEKTMCLRCHEIPYTFKNERHKHRLLYDHKYERKCCGCGSHYQGEMFKCKECAFGLEYRCLTLPGSVWYKNDVHPLTLCTSPGNEDPSQWYCDICEEKRNPNDWFYHCADCNVSTHPWCVLGGGPFVKLGKPFKYGGHDEHLVTFVKFDFNPPKCNLCNKHCRDVAIQCTKASCKYIVDWLCVPEFYILH